MTAAFDPRIVRVGVEVDGAWNYFQDLDIRVQGQRFCGSTSAFATIKISNIERSLRNKIITKMSLLTINGSRPANVTVDVGRVGKGTFRLFTGLCYSSGVTIPPDIGVTFRTIEASGLRGALEPNSLGPLTRLSVVAQYVANRTGNVLEFTVSQDRNIANVSYPASPDELIPYLNSLGGIVAVAADKVLSVFDETGYARSKGFVLSQQTGMVGIPQASPTGCTAQMLVSGDVRIGDLIGVKSTVNPAVDGNYRVEQIAFDIANRDNPFFYNLSLTSRWAQAGLL